MKVDIPTAWKKGRENKNMKGRSTKNANEAPTRKRIEKAATKGYTDCFSLALMAGSTNLYISYTSTGTLVANPNTADPTTISSRGVVTVPPISMYCGGKSLGLFPARMAWGIGWVDLKGVCRDDRAEWAAR